MEPTRLLGSHSIYYSKEHWRRGQQNNLWTVNWAHGKTPLPKAKTQTEQIKEQKKKLPTASNLWIHHTHWVKP